jgi:5'-methylthioadenosine phosphorylase
VKWHGPGVHKQKEIWMSQTGDDKRPLIGMIGGSGLYDMEGLSNTQWVRVESAFGEPSDELLFGEIDGNRIVFLPRHGRGHRIPPTQINYRANIDALKRAGVTDILSFSAVGSLREDLPPGSFVVVDQFIDRTFAREKSFFGEGLAAHVAVAHPTCSRLGDALEAAANTDVVVRRGGTYIAIEGPQFSTLAESNLYRQWGCDVIGMTNMPEAKLAREAEICYATMAMVTDFDTWHPDHDSVTVEMVIKVLSANALNAASLARRAVPELQDRPDACPNGCDRVLDTAIITASDSRDPEMVTKLSAVAGRVL